MSEVLLQDNLHIYSSLGEKVENLKNSTVLVTGSRGFLGKTICSFLGFLNQKKFNKKEQIKIIEIDYQDNDICNPLNETIQEGRVDYIINCAGIASPKKYLKAPLKTLDVSYLGTKNVLETLCYVYHNSYKVPVNVLRPFNLYGPLMDISDGRIIPNICKAIMEGKDFSVYGTGEQTRTYCYVTDAIVYFFEILFSQKFGEIYNVGSEGEELSALEIAEKSYSIIKPENSQYFIKPYPDEYPNNEPQRRCPDISKVKREFGYSPKYTFNKGLLSCYTFFVSIDKK